jgi:hypothetical protein
MTRELGPPGKDAGRSRGNDPAPAPPQGSPNPKLTESLTEGEPIEHTLTRIASTLERVAGALESLASVADEWQYYWRRGA